MFHYKDQDQFIWFKIRFILFLSEMDTFIYIKVFYYKENITLKYTYIYILLNYIIYTIYTHI